MPEAPEVKLSADLIKPLVINKQLLRPKIGPGRYAKKEPENYLEFTTSFIEDDGISMISELIVTDIQVKGKFMYWSFSNGWYLFNTFGMSGQWGPDPGKHVCFWFNFAEKDYKRSSIYFNDPRHFGTIKFTNNKQELIDKLNELGWDSLNEPERLKEYFPFIKRKLKINKPIGQMLMDQKVFCGTGNYIRAEALYVSKISPWTISSQLSDEQIEKLCNAIVIVMQDSYNHQGATIHTYKTAYGEDGKYSSKFQVYGQKQDPLGNPVKKETTPEGRTIHWVPAIQM